MTIHKLTGPINDEEFEIVYLNNQGDLGQFIGSHTVTKLDDIPMKAWFTYRCDDSGDRPIVLMALLQDYVSDLIDTIFKCSANVMGIQKILNDTLGFHKMGVKIND